MSASEGFSSFTAFRWLVWRDLAIAWRRRTDTLAAMFFFVMVVSLFPFAAGPEAQLLRDIGPGVVWVAALLASMLSLGRLFESDYSDGTLEQMLLSPQPLYLTVLAKALAQSLLSAAPLTVLAPVVALQFGLSPSVSWILAISLVLGIPSLCLVGSIGAALTLGVRGGGLMIAVLVLPLYVPVLIFGAAAGASNADANLSLLAALLILTTVFAPAAAAAALRLAVE
jgi:heme exporter protein B